MNTQAIDKQSISKKILYAFLLASFIPILCLTYFSSSYVSNVLEKETHSNLLKHAKSYGLFTFEKILSFKKQLDKISQLTDNALSNNIISDFNNIELSSIQNIDTTGFDNSDYAKLSYYHDDNKNLNFVLEKLHQDSLGKRYVLRASFTIDSLFNDHSETPYNEPICIFTKSGSKLFCSEDIAIEDAALNNASNLINTRNRVFHHTFEDKEYTLTAWELFLPSRFQSEPWYFVILKEQSIVLATIKKFQALIIPIASLFFLIVAYAIYLFIRRLMSPLLQLISATKKIARGNYIIDLDINTNDEFKDLGDSFINMSTSLMHQHNKDEVFSKIEHSVLSNSNIHIAVKNNIDNLIKLFDVESLIISLVDPINPTLTDSHCARIENDHSKKYYTQINHDSFLTKNTEKNIYSIDNDHFHATYRSIAEGIHANKIWVKNLYLTNENIGHIFLIEKNSGNISKQNTALLLEFSERFSTIYTTYKQSADLYYKAHFDSLTKLPNRNYLLESLRKKWPIAIKNKTNIAIFYIDLDQFKSVNDLSGHKAGNKVLFQVAKRLKQCTNNNAIIARLSGDEFCILLENVTKQNDVITLSENILEQLKKPFVIKDMSYFLGASIGIAIGKAEMNNPDALIENADLAMYKAKQDGKNQYVIFDKQIQDERNYRLSLEHYLHFALEENEITINYQPKIDLITSKLVSVECLARWHQKELGFVPTEKFITLAEESGMINEIGRWILRKSCFQFMDWLKKDIQLESIAVNVSARQLASKNFSKIVASVIDETNIPPHCLDLEITESAFINDQSLLNDELGKLHDLGVKISIDDFGKEYSSLSYLKKIPFDTLKIDREFIIDLENDHRDQHIVDVIINIGHTLNKKIVAEGIETIKQRELLKNYGCDIGQGYLFSRPLSDIEFLAFAAQYKAEGMPTETLKALSHINS